MVGNTVNTLVKYFEKPEIEVTKKKNKKILKSKIKFIFVSNLREDI